MNTTWKHDLSTIDLEKLARLCKPVDLKNTYTLSDHFGSACFGDPPGYPSYFVRSIYTAHGNSPSKGPDAELLGYGLSDGLDLRRIYLPLPEEHPRVQAWEADLYRHQQHCYHDASAVKKDDELLIYPVPYYKLKSFQDDARFSEEWREKEKASIAQWNAEVQKHAAQVATADNHRAVRSIRKYYPEHQPRLDWINEPPADSIQNWWERYDHRPEVGENCPGDRSIRARHEVGKFCQFCGRTE